MLIEIKGPAAAPIIKFASSLSFVSSVGRAYQVFALSLLLLRLGFSFQFFFFYSPNFETLDVLLHSFVISRRDM